MVTVHMEHTIDPSTRHYVTALAVGLVVLVLLVWFLSWISNCCRCPCGRGDIFYRMEREKRKRNRAIAGQRNAPTLRRKEGEQPKKRKTHRE